MICWVCREYIDCVQRVYSECAESVQRVYGESAAIMQIIFSVQRECIVQSAKCRLFRYSKDTVKCCPRV